MQDVGLGQQGLIKSRVEEQAESLASLAVERHKASSPLKQTYVEKSATGFRFSDQEMINYWDIKRGKPLLDCCIWVMESSGKIEAKSVKDLYELTQICFLPYLLFSDKSYLSCVKYSFDRETDFNQIQQQLDQCYLKKISDHVGWGLFARHSLEKGQVLGEYVGVVLPREQGGSYCMDYGEIENEVMDVDAKYFGNHTRFINHSENANVDALGYSDYKDFKSMRILVVANKPINQHQQVLIHYGNQYWLNRTPIDLDEPS